MPPCVNSSPRYEARIDIAPAGDAPLAAALIVLVALAATSIVRLGVAGLVAAAAGLATLGIVAWRRGRLRPSGTRDISQLVLTADALLVVAAGRRRAACVRSFALLPALGLTLLLGEPGERPYRVVALKQQQRPTDWRRAVVLWRFRGPALVAGGPSC